MHLSCSLRHLWLLIDPVELGSLVAVDLVRLEPQSDLLLGVLDAVRTVANIATNIDGIVTSDGTGSGGKRVGGTKDGYSLVNRRSNVQGMKDSLLRPVLTASRPSQTMAVMGPLNMSRLGC